MPEERTQERLQVFLDAWRTLAPLASPEALARVVVEKVKAEAGAVSVHFFVRKGEELVLLASLGPSPGPGLRLKRGQGLSWAVVEEGRPLYIPNVLQDPRAVFFREPGPGAYYGLPLKSPEGKVLGVLSLDTVGHARELTPAEKLWAEALAEASGAVLDRILTLARAQKEAQRAQGLLDLVLALEEAQNPLNMAQAALETLLRLTPYPAGALYLYQEDRVRPALAVGQYPPGFLELYEKHPIRFGMGLLGHPRLWEGPVYVEDYADFPGALEPFKAAGLASALLVPIKPLGQDWGILALGSFGQTIPYRKEDEALLRAVAHRLEEALERFFHLKTLEKTREAALKALARALEYRDLETKGHTDRVAGLALRLARALGFPDLEGLRLGAFLHDIGKLALPDGILNKPGSLSTTEWQVVRTHPALGYEILKDLPLLPRTALNVVLHHHERWDGTGYPKGLKGEEIPLEARIFAVVDVWDALLSVRPYKKAWTPEEARAELLRQAGKGLDPGLVEVFLREVAPGSNPGLTEPV